MLLYLINPLNPVVSMTKSKRNMWSKYRVWKPLGLLVVAGLTPPGWEIKVIDENIKAPDYASMPVPDLVGITAFTSQAERAYKIAQEYRKRNVPVVLGGIHATMCPEEALLYVDTIVKGEAESVWTQVLKDLRNGNIKKIYNGERLGMEHSVAARHDLLGNGYKFGMIQTTRGCPLSCNFCSVTAFNGGAFRRRPVDDVIKEFKMIKEKYVLIVDDNFIGTRRDHIELTKELLRAMIRAKIRKKWITQVTLNMGEDEELVSLAARAGCVGVFIGFETVSPEGLTELKKKFNVRKDSMDYKESVRMIQKYNISVVGSFIMGLDIDEKGIGKKIAETGVFLGIDALNVLFLTPLPGTRLWDEMQSQDRIAANSFPGDWKFYTLNFPVVRYRNFSWEEILKENEVCFYIFNSYKNIIKRFIENILHLRRPLLLLISNFSFRRNGVIFYKNDFMELKLYRGQAYDVN